MTPFRRRLNTVGWILLSGLAAVGGQFTGAPWVPRAEALDPAAAPPLREPPPGHPERVVPHASLGRDERRWWRELESSLQNRPASRVG